MKIEKLKNKIIWGDCLVAHKYIPDGSIDMICTDLPYGKTACKWDTPIDLNELWFDYNRIIKPHGAIILFGNEPFSSALRMSNIKYYKYDWIWKKTMATLFQHANKMPMRICENISVFYHKLPTYNPQKLKCDKPYTRKTGDRKISGFHQNNIKYKPNINIKESYPVNFIKFSNGNGNRLHPTQKPVPLIEYLIKTYTNEGELVLDSTAGVLTTGVAAKNLNRSFICIEQKMEYIKKGQTRFDNKLDIVKCKGGTE